MFSSCTGFYACNSHEVPLILARVSRATAVARCLRLHTLAPDAARISSPSCSRSASSYLSGVTRESAVCACLNPRCRPTQQLIVAPLAASLFYSASTTALAPLFKGAHLLQSEASEFQRVCFRNAIDTLVCSCLFLSVRKQVFAASFSA